MLYIILYFIINVEVIFLIEHITISSAFDALPLDVIIMAPAHPRAMIQISHGMCEHKERYFDFMNFLNKQGYACCIHDHRGHGKSLLHPSDLGYFYDNAHIALINDLHQLTTVMHQRYPQLPLYLLGHSMGALIARCYIHKYDYDIDGLILLSHPSYHFLSKAGVILTCLYSHIKNKHYRSNMIQQLAAKILNRRFSHCPENSWICSHLETVQKFNHDPLCHFTYTINGYQTLLKLMIIAYDNRHWQILQPDLPILYLAGSKDPCIISYRKFMQSIHQLKKIGYQNITYQIFHDMQHELLNEYQHEIIYNFIVQTIMTWNHKK